MEADEEERTHRGGEQDLALDDLEADENTNWLRGYGWPWWFRHKLKPVIFIITFRLLRFLVRFFGSPNGLIISLTCA